MTAGPMVVYPHGDREKRTIVTPNVMTGSKVLDADHIGDALRVCRRLEFLARESRVETIVAVQDENGRVTRLADAA